jgi:hypothetical protein
MLRSHFWTMALELANAPQDKWIGAERSASASVFTRVSDTLWTVHRRACTKSRKQPHAK